MRVSHTTEQWLGCRQTLAGRSIGFVPTMGALHRGHAALLDRCRRENEVVVASIFVNPTQFNNPQDLERYPRTIENDLALLERLGTDEVILPRAADLYPHGYRFRIEAESLTGTMEGHHRPGFLQGVMTIVLKLLNLVRADRAYFGEKDYEQLMVVTEMAREFFILTEIVPCPTVRAESGLAESSRNHLLSAAARQRAAVLFRSLTNAATPAEARAMIEGGGLAVEYVEENWGRRFAAAFLDGVRLIDNVPLGSCGNGDRDASLP
jgi:pantoate--beta-alanine ligase